MLCTLTAVKYLYISLISLSQMVCRCAQQTQFVHTGTVHIKLSSMNVHFVQFSLL